MARRFIILLGLLIIPSCQEDHPWWDASEWDMLSSMQRMAAIVELQQCILEEGRPEEPLDVSQRREIWALLIDECDIGFEIFVRVNRNGSLRPVVCRLLEEELRDPDFRRWAALENREDHTAWSLLASCAPSEEAWQHLGPRIEAYSVLGLFTRCSHPAGFHRWALPEDVQENRSSIPTEKPTVRVE